MGQRVENNVQVPDGTLTTLASIARNRGISRDECVRQLLDEHLIRQQALAPDDRNTHIATIMRHPLPAGRGKPKPGKPLRLRLDPGASAQALSLSFMLPGQSRYRGSHDYQARLLSDAVLSAIAFVEPIPDPLFDGLERQLLTHKEALGLWRLTVEATLTLPESRLRREAFLDRRRRQRAREAGETVPPRTYAEKVAEVMERDVAWHSSDRVSTMRALIAERLKRGPGREFLAVVHAQEDTLDPWRWDQLMRQMRRSPGRQLRRGTNIAAMTGRGGGAVWRAERLLATEEMLSWLRQATHPYAFTVRQPGWRLDVPNGWRPLHFPVDEGLPRVWAGHVDSGRVLRLVGDDAQILWPVALEDQGPVPVAGMDVVITAADRIARERPEQVVELTLLRLTGRISQPPSVRTVLAPKSRNPGLSTLAAGPAPEAQELYRSLRVSVPVYTAHAFGLIGTQERDRLVGEVDVLRRNFLDELTVEGVDDPQLLELKKSILNNRGSYRGLLRHVDPDVRERLRAIWADARWHWPISSLGEQIVCEQSRDRLEWLAKHLLRGYTLALENSMELASRAAFDEFQPYSRYSRRQPPRA